MSNLVPTPIVDRNGVATTRNKRVDKPGNGSARVSKATVQNAKPAGEVILNGDIYRAVDAVSLGHPEISFEFDSRLDSELDQNDGEFFDVRDIASMLKIYSNGLEEYRDSFEFDDQKEALVFSETDEFDFENLRKELEVLHKAANDFGVVPESYWPDRPSDYGSVQEWIDYTSDLSNVWEQIGIYSGVTATSQDGLSERAESLTEGYENTRVSDIPFFMQQGVEYPSQDEWKSEYYDEDEDEDGDFDEYDAYTNFIENLESMSWAEFSMEYSEMIDYDEMGSHITDQAPEAEINGKQYWLI